MNKAYQYASDVANGHTLAPEQVKQACINFIYEFDVLQHQEDYEFMWNKEIEKKVIAIVQRLNFARGSKAKKPIYDNMAGFQHFILFNTFCWVWKEFPTKRKYREVIFTVGRKNAKSVLAVVIHIVSLYLDEDNANQYIGSNTYKQANIIFTEMTMIIKDSPKVRKHFVLKKTYIDFLPESVNGLPAKNCRIEALSGDASKADGTQVFVASVDELGASNEIQKMVASIETGQFGPRNPLILKISTSYPVVNEENYWQDNVGYLYDNTFAFANKYMGRVPGENEKSIDYVSKTFGLAFLIDDPLSEVEVDGKIIKRWQDEKVWVEANPLFAEVPSLWEKLVEDYHTKKNVPSEIHLFKIKNLNMWLSSSMDENATFADSTTANKYIDDELNDMEWWRGKLIFVGVDLSLSRDNTAVTIGHRDLTNGKTYFKNIVFYPEEMEAEKTSTEGIPYRQWSELGWSQALGKDTVDFIGIGKFIEKLVKDYDLEVATFLYDDTYAHQLLEYVMENVPMEINPARIHQDAKSLGPIIMAMQQDLFDGKISYARNKFLTGSFVNGEIEFRHGKVYITKNSKRRNKIDSLFATLNAYKGIMTFERHGYFNMNYEIDVIYDE